MIAVAAATEPIGKRYLAAQESLEYRLWLARNMGGGYTSIFDRPLQRSERRVTLPADRL